MWIVTAIYLQEFYKTLTTLKTGKLQRLGTGVTVKQLVAGGRRGMIGITGIRTAGSVTFLDNNNGLGEEFSRNKIIY